MKTRRDQHAELFADYMIGAMERTRLRQSQIAAAAQISRQMVSQIVGKKPHSLTGKLLLPAREIVDRIAIAFGDPVWKARRAAGYSEEGGQEEKLADSEVDQKMQASRAAELIRSFLNMTPDQQAQALAIIQILQADLPEVLKTLHPLIEIGKTEDPAESEEEMPEEFEATLYEEDDNAPPLQRKGGMR